MPELPEVETIRRGIEPQVLNRTVANVIVREHRLRWPVPQDLAQQLVGSKIKSTRRRSKYLLLECDRGSLMVHLGMSGRLWVVNQSQAPAKHDHIDIVLDNQRALRYHDPRRFGSVLWETGTIDNHPLLAKLGPEPLSDAFEDNWLFRRSRGRKVAVKNFIMDSHVVVGVGNIYASEALHQSGIHPERLAGSISAIRYRRLQQSIRDVLQAAIKAGGTTLRDFANADGMPGYFQIELSVYGREGQPCLKCAKPVRRVVIGQRSTFFCSGCQH